jgi:hypothetical protein
MQEARERWYRLPLGDATLDIEKYCKAWNDVGNAALEFFPGWVLSGYDPNIHLELHEINEKKGTYRSIDSVQLSPACVLNMAWSKT